MAKLWEGRSGGSIDPLAERLNASICVDSRMVREDIRGSIAHAAMLSKQGIITPEQGENIRAGLESILRDLDSGKLRVDMSCEDVHTFVEGELTCRIGDDGRRLHTARSRNDQVALDVRLYLRSRGQETVEGLERLLDVLCRRAEETRDFVAPGYTHMQRAQPVTFGHHLMAYAFMLLRDRGRMLDALRRMDKSPIGSCALAGTTFPTDREYEAGLLGFSGVTENSMDSVADRDFCVELSAALSLIMTHLSRFSEEIILWSTKEFGFVTVSTAYSTGSSIMPQKKNPDIAELVRGKTGRVYGDLFTLLTLLKGLPLAYNKDLQEDKEAVFDAFDTVNDCLAVFAPMVSELTVHPAALRAACAKGFINATDLADYLTGKGMPFRRAYKLTGELVESCSGRDITLEEVTLEELRSLSPLFEEDVFEAINVDNCLMRRTSRGGPTPASVMEQIKAVRRELGEYDQNKSGFAEVSKWNTGSRT